MFIRRLPIKYMSYLKRVHGLNTLDLSRIESLKKAILILIMFKSKVQRSSQPDEGRIKSVKKLIQNLLLQYKQIAYMEEIPRTVRPAHQPRTIASFNHTECWRNFRFKRQDLRRLQRVLLLQDVIKIKRHVFGGQEILLYSLHRLSTHATHYDLAQYIYGRDFSVWSLAYNWFISYIIGNFIDLLYDNLPYWSTYFAECAATIEAKMLSKSGLEFEEFYVCAFHDCTVIGCSRPGGGPAEDGVGAARYNNYIQMTFYSGWKCTHGLKFLTMEMPNGLCAYMFGPYPFRRHDIDLYRDGELNDKMAAAQNGNIMQFLSYGDSIFPRDSHCTSKNVGITTERQKDENDSMCEMRICNEWHYGLTGTLFPRVKHKSSNKILNGDNVSMVYVVATLLRNARVCLYGSQTSRYFEMNPPSLEDYFAQNVHM